ncbi:MAG: ATPase, partial [Lachnospiraceae bacterium]|nr:ATPase [Lachnospiraceae bacterium]
MINKQRIISIIREGQAVLGIELGSTRIKAVLIDDNHHAIAAASYEWQKCLENGIWTYDLDLVWKGLQDAYSKLAANIENEYGIPLTKLSAIGISAMMHGYLVFDQSDRQLVPFRTWRNTMTEEAAEKLTELFGFNIPQRWSIAHLYQAILNKENHVPDIRFMTTLSSYVHWRLTGEKVIGIGDASGMFPIDSIKNNYDAEMLQQFEKLIKPQGYDWTLSDILPKVLSAGEPAGRLTVEGAQLLDPSGKLESGTLLCPPEGDAGTGMVATNSVEAHTGNISAGTSV